MKLLRTVVLVTVFPLLIEAASVPTPVTIFSGGIFLGNQVTPVNFFNFAGPGFSVNGTINGSGSGFWGPILNSTVPEGGTVSVSGSLFPSNFGFGTATVDGMVFDNVQWGVNVPGNFSALSVDGDPITIGPPLPVGFFNSYQSTFMVFLGTLCGVIPSAPDTCTINLTLSGGGVVTTSAPSLPNGLQAFNSATYTFIPEPGTWMLLAFGAATGLVLRRVRA